MSYRPLTYLACPYTAPSAAIKVGRFVSVTRAAAALMRQYRWNVFSPITHSHPIHEIGGMLGDWKTWKRIDTQYLRLSSRLVVLTLLGWERSVGVNAEIKIARRFGVPIFYLKPGARTVTRKP